MPKTRNRRPTPRATRGRSQPTGGIRIGRVAVWSAAIVGGAVLLYFAAQLANPTSSVDAESESVAEGNARGAVDVLTGTRHTVYHSPSPLPEPASPQPQSLPTLVWFSGTWCEFCEHMDPFAHSVMSEFRERAVLVEKSVDHDRSAANRYGIRGTPTFVLVDETGRAVTRFGFQANAEAFAATIESALAKLDAGDSS